VLVWIAVADTYLEPTGPVRQVAVAVIFGGAVFVPATVLARPPGFDPVAERVGGLGRRIRPLRPDGDADDRP
jgi:hypothetical protein